jgi:hypothetical protein
MTSVDLKLFTEVLLIFFGAQEEKQLMTKRKINA